MARTKVGGYWVEIDRPKGSTKQMRTRNGSVVVTYPVDYGFFQQWVNPQDREGADVFVGSEPDGLYGWFMKGTDYGPQWAPDEWKWYAALTHQEFRLLVDFWERQSRGLARDYQSLGDADGLIFNLQQNCWRLEVQSHNLLMV